MIDFQMVIDLLTPVSITFGIIYYVMVLRNQSRTRQIQLLMQLSESYTEETSKRSLELLEMEWTTHEEFERKYGSDNNPDNFAKRVTAWNRYNTQGMLLKHGLVTPELLFGSGRGSPMHHWKKFGSVIEEIRTRYSMPIYCNGFEYLAQENRKYLEKKGYKIDLPDTYYSYVPDKEPN